ncbi:MAG: transketolase [Alphaproteobacteria bacterium]|nr:transketolase [Alphaproteobacteria bacterium]MCY4230061.1 transketolase [Alphaproteobacteria bacterium]MCY4320555.1 transketolase [Alphaproteobacteria bacterium]
MDAKRLAALEALECKVLWLSSWMIHNANHLRNNRDGLKVGGHQASSASAATILTALYFDTLKICDRVAVKPHASPVYHAIQYLLGRQSREKLERFRAFGGAQSYPSRTKDSDDVDFSTGSVGLGVGITTFASIMQDYLRLKGLGDSGPPGRMVAVMGDAEIDEGNIFEAMLEGWKHDVRNLWWIIDYNRQSLDSVVTDRLFRRFDGIFRAMGWQVCTLKYGKRLQAAFRKRDGKALERWIDDCPNSLYSALVYKGGAAWREALQEDLGQLPGIRTLLKQHDDEQLHDLMTNLAGQDMAALLEGFASVEDDRPTCFIAYTIKGYGLPFAGHKDNHAGLMNSSQMEAFQTSIGIRPGEEWDPAAGLDVAPERLRAVIEDSPFYLSPPRRRKAALVALPDRLPPPAGTRMSTQEAFGRILVDIAREGGSLADRIVTASPDVTVSTGLSGWVNQRGIFARDFIEDVFKEENVVSAQRWRQGPTGQHVELGIAENNLFLCLAALGLSAELAGERLFPVGTLYDPFIARGLDALNYAAYQDARFMVVATPSGVTLAPEGGAHQSSTTPGIGLAQPGLTAFEPAYADELAAIMHWGFGHMQAEDGGAVYLRLSTRPLEQPKRDLDIPAAIAGGYWLEPPTEGTDLAIVAMGAVLPEALTALAAVREDIPDAGLLAVTSADRLYCDWLAHGDKSRAARLLASVSRRGGLVTVLDGHPSVLGWLGSIAGHRVQTLGTTSFGQSGDIPDLYQAHGLDADAILHASARLLLHS